MTALLVGAVASPAWFQTGEELFPLSDYPMFSTPRPPREVLFFVEVVRADGVVERLDAEVVSRGGAGKARKQLETLARKPPSDRLPLCRSLAATVPGEGELRVVRGVFSLPRLRLDRVAEPVRSGVIVACPVPG